MLASDPRCEDLAYTKQFFSLIRNGHARPTATFGAPTMIWHVSFWPRRHKDPHEFEMRDHSSGSGLKTADQIRDERSGRFNEVTAEFDLFLLGLQQRGCVQGADLNPPFALLRNHVTGKNDIKRRQHRFGWKTFYCVHVRSVRFHVVVARYAPESNT